jgi:hypothetical protein
MFPVLAAFQRASADSDRLSGTSAVAESKQIAPLLSKLDGHLTAVESGRIDADALVTDWIGRCLDASATAHDVNFGVGPSSRKLFTKEDQAICIDVSQRIAALDLNRTEAQHVEQMRRDATTLLTALNASSHLPYLADLRSWASSMLDAVDALQSNLGGYVSMARPMPVNPLWIPPINAWSAEMASTRAQILNVRKYLNQIMANARVSLPNIHKKARPAFERRAAPPAPRFASLRGVPNPAGVFLQKAWDALRASLSVPLASRGSYVEDARRALVSARSYAQANGYPADRVTAIELALEDASVLDDATMNPPNRWISTSPLNYEHRLGIALGRLADEIALYPDVDYGGFSFDATAPFAKPVPPTANFPGGAGAGGGAGKAVPPAASFPGGSSTQAGNAGDAGGSSGGGGGASKGPLKEAKTPEQLAREAAARDAAARDAEAKGGLVKCAVCDFSDASAPYVTGGAALVGALVGGLGATFVTKPGNYPVLIGSILGGALLVGGTARYLVKKRVDACRAECA